MISPIRHAFILIWATWMMSLRLIAGDTEHWSMGPLGGTFQIVVGSNMLTVQSVPAGTPAAAAGLRVGDRILGAFGEDFRPINTQFTGSVQDFGSAIDRAEGSGGVLPLRVLRPGVGLVEPIATLPAVGYFGPAFPLGSPKFDTLYETSCAQIHAGANSWFGGAAQSPTNGNLTNLGWMGLLMLSHPNWADTSGAKAYRNSINIMRNQAVAVLDNIVLAPVKNGQPGHVNPGLENWQISAMTMFLAEYVNRTGDTAVMPTLQRACDALANRIQHDGHMGHGGVEGDYGNWGLHIINIHTHAAFAFAKRAGANINQAKWDLSWGQLRSSTARGRGNDHPEDGYVAYGPGAWGQGTGWDASGRTAGAFFGFYNYGKTPTADDTDALTRMKNYVVRHHERFQRAHAYTVGGVGFTHYALPYLSDREQRHILDNLRYFYQFHRTANPDSLAYFGGRGNNGGDGYLNFNRVKLYNAAFAMAVFNGGLPSVPGVNQDRILVHMKSPWTRWPTLEAKTATLTGLSHNLDVEITDWQGTPMSSGFTANWSKISGPGSVTFGNASQPSTSVSFSSGGRHRLQLTATAGSQSVTEFYDFDVFATATPGGYVAGIAQWDLYDGVAGTTVASLTGHASFPDAPTTMGTVTSLDLPHRSNNFGQRVRGVIIPPATGAYRFHIASDDASHFRFNPAGPEEGGAVVCRVDGWTSAYNWTANATQQSTLFNLTAGQPYFFEILHKEATGATHCAVAWTGPGIATPTVIGAESIAAPDTTEILRHPVSRIASPGGTANFDVLVRGPGPFLYEWRLDGVAYWGQSTTATLTVPNIGPATAGEYTCIITTPGGTVVSEPATLSLNTTPQTVQGLLREVWTGVSGSTIADLTGHPGYPRQPDITSVVSTAETPQNFADNYGQRLSGWVVPRITGNYRFFLSSDDASQLWLSPDDNPANKVQRAQITGWSNYRTYSASSSFISLTAGQRYYIEILHKEGGGADHLSLAWQMPGGSAPTTGSAPIPGEFLECTIQTGETLSNGLVAWWRMDDAAGTTATDSTSTAADGSINGATWTTGRRAGGLHFNGGQSVHCGRRASLAGTTPFTVTAWVRVNSGTSQEGTIIQQRASDGFNGQYRFYVSNTGRLGFYVYGNSAQQFNFTANTAINNGNWHHVAAVRDANGNAYLYLNGQLDGSVTGTTQRSLSSSISVGIGADIRDSNRYFRGTLDDIRIFNRDLSQEEISLVRNQAPVIAPTTIDLGQMSAGDPLALDLNTYASDPDIGETLSWEKISGPAWLSVAANGTASGTPTAGNAGDNIWTLRATDSVGLFAETTLRVSVETSAPSPAFSANPIDGGSLPDSSTYVGTLAGTASDPDAEETLAFSITSGPAWLEVSTNGTLTGTPASADLGPNEWTVRATNGSGLFGEAILQIQVTPISPRWINPAGGSWASSSNWIYGNVVGDVDRFADFSNLALGSNPTVSLDGARTLGSLAFADSANAFGWTLVSGSGGPLTLSVSEGVPQWSVLNQSVVMQGVLAGSQGFVKSGAGTLQIATAGTWTGATTVAEGTLEVLAKTGDVPYEVLPGATLRLGYTTGGGYAATHLKVRGSGLAATSGLYFRGGASYNASGQIEVLDAPTRIRHYGTGLASIGMFDINGNGLRVTSAASGSQIDAEIQFISRGYGMSMDIASGSATAEGDLVLHGPLNVGSLGFYKRGDGSVRLNAAATATNTAVKILNGSVIAGNADVLGAQADLAVSSGALLRLNGFDQSARQLSGAGRIVNGGSPATLSLNQTADTAFSGVLGGTGANENSFALVKGGSASLTLSGANTYSGDTTVEAGTLSLGSATLADGAAVRISASATLHLPHGQADTVFELWIDGEQQAAGTYDADDLPGRISGSGSLVVTSGPDPANTPYQDWLAAAGKEAGQPGTAPLESADGSGVPNLIQFALGGDLNNPANNGVHHGFDFRHGVVGDPMLLTIAVREGAVFSAGPAPAATIDGVTYTILGSHQLNGWSAPVEEVTPAHHGNGTVAAPPGYELHSFRIVPAPGGDRRAFLRVAVAETP